MVTLTHATNVLHTQTARTSVLRFERTVVCHQSLGRRLGSAGGRQGGGHLRMRERNGFLRRHLASTLQRDGLVLGHTRELFS